DLSRLMDPNDSLVVLPDSDDGDASATKSAGSDSTDSTDSFADDAPAGGGGPTLAFAVDESAVGDGGGGGGGGGDDPVDTNAVARAALKTPEPLPFPKKVARS